MNPNDPYGINGSYQDNPSGTGLEGAFNGLTDNTNQQSAYGVPGSAVTGGAAGYVGSGGGIGKTGGFLGIGNENIQQQLAASGYRMYTPTAAPNVASLFGTNQNPELQFRQGQLGLMNQLQGQALGTGPSAAVGTLQAGSDRTMGDLMSAIAAGRGSPGSATGALSAGATAGQTAADQAAILRAQEIQSAQGQLGGVTQAGAAGDLGEQQLRANQGAGLAGIDQGNWQYLNSLNANQQGALNSNINQGVQGANTSQQGLVGTGIGALAGGVGALAKLAAHGTVADHGPELRVIGEAGPEAVVPIRPDGSPDMSRATDPKLKWILESHQKSGYSVPNAKASGMPGAMPQADHGILGAIVALLHDVQNPARAR